MGRLQARLDRIQANFAAQAPAEAREVMHRATAELQASDLVAHSIGVGHDLPSFSLEDSDGTTVSSEALLAQGPLVLTVYRGVW